MVRCHRWPLRRYTSTRYMSDFGDNSEGGALQDESGGESGDGEGGGRVGAAGGRGGAELWGKVRKAFRDKNGTDCDCKWCRVLGSSRCAIYAREMIMVIREAAREVVEGVRNDMLAVIQQRARLLYACTFMCQRLFCFILVCFLLPPRSADLETSRVRSSGFFWIFLFFFRFSRNKVPCALVDFCAFLSLAFSFSFCFPCFAGFDTPSLSLSSCVLPSCAVLCAFLRHSSGRVHMGKISSCKHRMSSWRRRRSSSTMQTSTALERWGSRGNGHKASLCSYLFFFVHDAGQGEEVKERRCGRTGQWRVNPLHSHGDI